MRVEKRFLTRDTSFNDDRNAHANAKIRMRDNIWARLLSGRHLADLSCPSLGHDHSICLKMFLCMIDYAILIIPLANPIFTDIHERNYASFVRAIIHVRSFCNLLFRNTETRKIFSFPDIHDSYRRCSAVRLICHRYCFSTAFLEIVFSCQRRKSSFRMQ